MTTLLVILVVSAVGFALARRWQIAAAPFLLIAGMTLGAFDLLGPTGTVQNVMLLGLTFLVLVVGAELDPDRVLGRWRLVLGLALAQFALLAGCGFLAARILQFDLIASLYIALAVTASSTLLVVDLLRRRRQFFEPFGRIVVGVLFVQDVLVILCLPALTRVSDGLSEIGLALLATAALILLAIVVRRWGCSLLIRWVESDDEGALLVVLAVLFAFVGLAHAMDLPLAVGAFAAGVTMSRFPVSVSIRGHLTSMADFFLAVFFVTLGAFVSLPGWRQFMLESVLLLSVMLISPPLVMVIVRRAGLSTRSSIEAAHFLAQCGEFSLVIMLAGLERGHVGPGTFAVIVLVAVVTMSLTPLLSTDGVAWGLMRWLPGERRAWPATPPEDHILLLGCGQNQRQLLPALTASGHPLLVVDDDAGIVDSLRRDGIRAVRGDGADYRLLRAAGARQARVVVSTMRRMHDHERLLRFVFGPQVIVRVFDPDDGDRIRSRGATPIVESEAAADAFMVWLDSGGGGLTESAQRHEPIATPHQ